MGINLADKGYNDVAAAGPGEFIPLQPGGYVCKIINAEFATSKAGNLMLVLFIDIAEGDFQGYFKNSTDILKKYDTTIKWSTNGIYRQLLFDQSGRVSRFFKGLLSCFELSNHSFHVNINNFDPSSLRGLLCGFIFAAEEYQKRDGSVAQRVQIKFPKSLDDIHNGNFKIPDLKKIDKPAQVTQKGETDILAASSIDPTDIPF